MWRKACLSPSPHHCSSCLLNLTFHVTKADACIDFDRERYCHVHERFFSVYLRFFWRAQPLADFSTPLHPIVGGTRHAKNERLLARSQQALTSEWPLSPTHCLSAGMIPTYCSMPRSSRSSELLKPSRNGSKLLKKCWQAATLHYLSMHVGNFSSAEGDSDCLRW